MNKHIHIPTSDCKHLLTCFCGYQDRMSSPLGAFMSGWRKVIWEEGHGQCWRCDRENRVLEMEES